MDIQQNVVLYISNERSIGFCCWYCEEIIALLNATGTEWYELKHDSNIDIYFTVCKECEHKTPDSKYIIGQALQKDNRRVENAYINVSEVITGHIRITEVNNSIIVVNRYSIFSMAPKNYILTSITTTDTSPSEGVISCSFF